MRFIAILAVIGILYFALTRNSPVQNATQAVAEAEAVAPSSTPAPAPHAASAAAAPSPTPTALRRPIVRTREVLGQLGQRNGAGEF